MCVYRKQCIELEQQFDFLKDLVATVPDMQGEGEENHTEGGGEKVPRRYLSVTCSHTRMHAGALSNARCKPTGVKLFTKDSSFRTDYNTTSECPLLRTALHILWRGRVTVAISRKSFYYKSNVFIVLAIVFYHCFPFCFLTIDKLQKQKGHICTAPESEN